MTKAEKNRKVALQKAVGEIIVERMALMNISIPKIYELTGINRNTMDYIRNGRRMVSYPTLMTLAEVLNTSAWTIMKKAELQIATKKVNLHE